MQKNFRTRLIAVFISALAAGCAYPHAVQTDTGAAPGPLAAAIRLYQSPLNHLAAVRSGECPMYPSDSAYGLQSIRKHGPVIGWIMAIDRLMRCGRDETRLAPRIRVDGKLKYYDPVAKNDFWWSEK